MGKTYSMVDYARWEFKKRLCQVYTDMTSLRFPEQVYLDIERIEELAYVEQGILLLDEAQIGLASGKWQSVPDEAMRAMAQFRKNGLDVVYTTQHPDRVVKVMRENTHLWVRCRKAGPMILQTWKGSLSDKRGKLKVVPLRRSGYRLYDTFEVLGAKPKRMLTTSEPLAAARRARSEADGRKAGTTGEVPVWHVAHDGVQVHQLTVAARDVLELLKRRGIVANHHPDLLDWVESETRRRAWLEAFGLTANEVAEECVFEHPWAKDGCKCHRDPNEPFVRPAWSISDVMPETIDKGAVMTIAGRRMAASPVGLWQALQWGGEILADRLGKYQVKRAVKA